jgi:hypothetical protein
MLKSIIKKEYNTITYVLLFKSPKKSLGDLLFLLRFLLLFLLLLFLFFLSGKHELIHGRSQELQDRISWGSKGVGVTIESYGKLEISYINVDNF